MCLILIKPPKAKMNDRFLDIVEKAVRGNPDGSSFGIIRDRVNGVDLRRGIMNGKALLESLEEAEVGTHDILVVHMRIATQGSICEMNTHGFTIGTYEQERLLEGNMYETTHVFHNGGFYGKLAQPKFDGDKDYSDTRLVTKNLLAKKLDGKLTFAKYLFEARRKCPTEYAFTNMVIKEFPLFSSQKVALLDGDYGLLTIGTFSEDRNGYLHSHSSYIENKYTQIY